MLSEVMSTKVRSRVFITFAALSFVVSIYHVVGMFYKVNQSPTWRHGLFAAVSLCCFYGFYRRPKYFVYFFGLLLIQQFYSHGFSMVNLWVEKGQVDWISVVLLMLLPVALLFLIQDRTMKRDKVSEEV